jgi:hypothetical protein
VAAGRSWSRREASGCDWFQVSATGPGYRDVVLSVAEQVHLRAPGGSVAVPDVVGLAVPEAQDVLARAGLVPTGDTNFTSSSRATVADQSPASGVEVAVGAEVVLTRSAHDSATGARDGIPLDDRALLCPPTMLDLRELDVDWSIAPGTWFAVYEGPRLDGPMVTETYAISCEHDGTVVTLDYPAPPGRADWPRSTEEATLPDGRTARLESGEGAVAVVLPASDPIAGGCGSFMVTAEGRDARSVTLAGS